LDYNTTERVLVYFFISLYIAIDLLQIKFDEHFYKRTNWSIKYGLLVFFSVI